MPNVGRHDRRHLRRRVGNRTPARLFNLFRFVGVSAFFALTLLMGVVLENPGWVNDDWILFAAYWVASGLLLWLRRPS